MNPVSEINQWCQKNGKSLPNYDFLGGGVEWRCMIYAEWLRNDLVSPVCPSKRDAKNEAAKRVCQGFLRDWSRFVIELKSGPICLLIDGDQRMDCWRWLADPNVQWPKFGLTARVYVSPTAPVVQCPEGREIQVIKAKTTNRDSADAKILMDLGGMLKTDTKETYVIVSSDHILVQAAEDNALSWVGNLEGLKEYLNH